MVQLTEPKPITTGELLWDLGILEIGGIYLYSPLNDVLGAYTASGNRLSVRFSSPTGAFGTSTAYEPVMVITLKVPETAVPGQVIPVRLDEIVSSYPAAGPATGDNGSSNGADTPTDSDRHEDPGARSPER